MRNWNSKSWIVSGYKMLVWIVPMRNWNFLWRTVFYCPSYGLDRTYEELKLECVRYTIKHPAQSLDRTYEELKRKQIPNLVIRSDRFGSYLWGIETIQLRK